MNTMSTAAMSLDDLLDAFLDGRINAGEMRSELSWRDEQHQRELQRYRQIGEDTASELRQERDLLRRILRGCHWSERSQRHSEGGMS